MSVSNWIQWVGIKDSPQRMIRSSLQWVFCMGGKSAELGLKMKIKVSRKLKEFKFSQHQIFLMWSQPEHAISVTKQDPVGLSGQRAPPPPPCPPPDLCLQRNFSLLDLPEVPKTKFNQRTEKMQKERKTVKQDKVITVQPLKRSRTFSSSSGSTDNILSHIL